ncbi:MAG: YadA-like family protein [Phascolarctobacterium sp.]|nr:YadA-like family protein [Phascolarctobacterium sp.]
MKKSLAKKITLSILAGAMLMTSSVAWAEDIVGVDSPGVYTNNSYSGSLYVGPGGGGGNIESANSIIIGYDAGVGGVSTITNDGANGVAIGVKAIVHGTNNVAIGYGSYVGKESDVVSVGSGTAYDVDGAPDYRRIINVADGTAAHDAVTVGQLNAAIASVQTGSVDLSGYYTKTETDSAITTAISGKANAADVYTKTEADATFVKIENNKISNNGDITFDVGTTNKDNIVTISTTGITVGSTSTHIDGNGVYVGAHNFEGAKAAMNDDGEVKGVNATFTGNVTAANLYDKTQIDNSLALKANSADVYQKTETYNKTEVDTKLDGKAEKATTLEGYGITDAYTKTEIDGMLGGSNASIAGINQRLDKTNAKINKVGAGAAALAALHPLEYDPDDKLTFSAGMGNYAGENAAALGAFYRPNEKFMVSLGGTMGNGENMVNLGLSIGLDKPNGYAKLSKRELIQEVNAVKAENNMLVQKVDAVEAENEAIKAEMAEMKALLQAIMAKK